MSEKKYYLNKTGLEHLWAKIKNKISEEANVQADWNETNATSDAYIKNKPSIPTMTIKTWTSSDIQ